jgi:pyruvate dehydrogenase kinase 2/3/4
MQSLVRQRTCGAAALASTWTSQHTLHMSTATTTTVAAATNRISAGNLSLTDFRKMSDPNKKEEVSFSSLAAAAANTSSSSATATGTSLDDPENLLQGRIDSDELQALASQRPTPLRLADMYKYGAAPDMMTQRIRNAQFLHRELQIRIAQRAVDLLTLPHGLSEVAPIRQVATVYLEYLQKFLQMPVPSNAEEEAAFTDMLQTLVLDRTSIPMDISRGVAAWREAAQEKDFPKKRLQEMEDALYRFFTARVGLRFLTEHHVLCSGRDSSRQLFARTHMFPPDHTNDHVTGCIQTNCDLVKEVSRVAALVRQQTLEHYGTCPDIDVVDCIREDSSDFTYVPHHLQYMLSELLKNSCRATVNHTATLEWTEGGHNPKVLPPIRVVVVKGEEDVTIKIADKGGGIPRSLITNIWKFAHSTADESELNGDFGMVEATGARIRGFGLPLARIYARYFGGELTLKSTEGYGLDSYLHLPRLGSSCENLPVRVRDSPGELDSMPPPRTAARRFSTTAGPKQQ